MDNNSQNTGTSPLHEDKTPNTRSSCAFSPDYLQKIYDAIDPYSAKDATVESRLNDSHSMAIDSLMGQISLLQDLAGSGMVRDDLEIRRHSLVSFADSVHRQLSVLDRIHGEFFTQVIKQREEDKEIIAHCESVISEQVNKIVALERTLSALKGGVQ